MDGNIGRVGETLRGNPIPLAMIGVGFGWLLLSGSGGTQRIGDAARSAGRTVGRGISDAAGRATSTASDMASRAGDLASDAASRVKGMVGSGASYATQGDYSYAREKFEARPAGWSGEAAGDDRMAGYGSEAASRARASLAASRRAARSARDTAQSARERAADIAGEQLGWARDRLSHVMEDHPLAVGLAGFLAGAAIALMLPTTAVEDDTFGETRDRLVDRAKHAGQDALAQAKDVAGNAADAAIEAVGTSTAGERRDTGMHGM